MYSKVIFLKVNERSAMLIVLFVILGYDKVCSMGSQLSVINRYTPSYSCYLDCCKAYRDFQSIIEWNQVNLNLETKVDMSDSFLMWWTQCWPKKIILLLIVKLNEGKWLLGKARMGCIFKATCDAYDLELQFLIARIFSV